MIEEAFPLRVTVDQARALPLPAGRRSALAMQHGSMQLRHYAPRGRDEQVPHDQDELYIVIAGSGSFVRDGVRTDFGRGDVLFAAAGTEHRFESFSADFETWVVFWGPPGGES